jgi:hypothetical protein
VPVPPALRDKVRQRTEDAAKDNSATFDRLAATARTQLKALEKKEHDYLDLVGDPDWPQEKLRQRLRQIRAQQGQLRRQLDAPSSDIERGRLLLLAALELLDRPQELYRLLDPSQRQMLNKAIFHKLYLDQDDQKVYVAIDELNEPFHSVVQHSRLQGQPRTRMERRNGAQANLNAVPDDLPLVALLDSALSGESFSKATMVGDSRPASPPGGGPGSKVG